MANKFKVKVWFRMDDNTLTGFGFREHSGVVSHQITEDGALYLLKRNNIYQEIETLIAVYAAYEWHALEVIEWHTLENNE